MFDTLSYEEFCEIKDTDFKVLDAEEDISLRLFRISEKFETPQNTSFSLYFKGPESNFLEQRIYNFLHEELGKGSLFIVPVEKNFDDFVYEAVFNRLKEI